MPNASCDPRWCCSTCGCPIAPGSTWQQAMSHREAPPAVVLVSTADYRYAVHDCGARGFLLKAELSVESLRAVLEEPA